MLRKTDHGPLERNRLSSLNGSVQGGPLHLKGMGLGTPMAGHWATWVQSSCLRGERCGNTWTLQDRLLSFVLTNRNWYSGFQICVHFRITWYRFKTPKAQAIRQTNNLWWWEHSHVFVKAPQMISNEQVSLGTNGLVVKSFYSLTHTHACTHVCAYLFK